MAWTVSAQPGGVAIEGHTVGVVVEGDPSDPNGRRIDAKPASGGHSLSSVDGAGNYHIELTGLLERGEPAEGRAFKILIQAMTSRGDQVERVVDPKPWRQLATQGSTGLDGDRNDAIALVREALVDKSRSCGSPIFR